MSDSSVSNEDKIAYLVSEFRKVSVDLSADTRIVSQLQRLSDRSLSFFFSALLTASSKNPYLGAVQALWKTLQWEDFEVFDANLSEAALKYLVNTLALLKSGIDRQREVVDLLMPDFKPDRKVVEPETHVDGSQNQELSSFSPENETIGSDDLLPWEVYRVALTALFTAYGQLSAWVRLKTSVITIWPYLVLMAATSFGRWPPLRFASIISAAYADTGHTSTTRQDIIAYVVLAAFLATFAVTLRDEFFTTKPRPISRDLNRAFTGFLIGQMGKLMGGG